MKQKKSSSYKFRVYPTTSNFSLSTDVVWANYNLSILVNACCIHIDPASVFLRFFVLSQPTNKSRRTFFFFFNPQLVFFPIYYDYTIILFSKACYTRKCWWKELARYIYVYVMQAYLYISYHHLFMIGLLNLKWFKREA
jgi:hypothetical protein